MSFLVVPTFSTPSRNCCVRSISSGLLRYPMHTCRALGCLFPHLSISCVFPKDNSVSHSSTSNILVNPQDTKTRIEATGHFRWLPAIGESLLYAGIMHTFDLATQTGTRDSLNGLWFQQYTRSVSELRGSWLRMWAILWKVRSSAS